MGVGSMAIQVENWNDRVHPEEKHNYENPTRFFLFADGYSRSGMIDPIFNNEF